QVLLPVPARPPQPGVGHVDPQRQLVLPGRELAVDPHAADLGRHLDRALYGPLDGDGDVDAVRARVRAHLGDARPRPRVQADRAPDAGRDERRAPVPAEVAGHLADEGVRLVVRAGAGAEPGRLRLRVLVRRGELDRQLVRARAQQRGDVEAV